MITKGVVRGECPGVGGRWSGGWVRVSSNDNSDLVLFSLEQTIAEIWLWK